MQNQQVIDQILAYVPKIDFDNTVTDISLFETTIRYLGGLLSGESSPRYLAFYHSTCVELCLV